VDDPLPLVSQHGRLLHLPDPPPWRFSRAAPSLKLPQRLDIHKDALRAAQFLPSPPMILAVNTALYLRRPLLLTGKPGAGKSTLIYKVAYELKLGPVIRGTSRRAQPCVVAFMSTTPSAASNPARRASRPSSNTSNSAPSALRSWPKPGRTRS
jgi:hypothetical protein